MTESSRADRIARTVDHLVARWSGADRTLLRRVFPLLARGAPVSVERIADVTGATLSAVEEALTRARAGRDAAGRVTELSGLTLDPTLHRVEVEGVALFSCCALLAHLTPLLLKRTVVLESVDPQSRRLIRLELAPDGVVAKAPATAVGTFVVTDARGIASDVAATFCRHVHHFADATSASMFAAADARRVVVDVSELRAAAEALYGEVWS